MVQQFRQRSYSKVSIENGRFAEFKPIVVGGRITDVAVVNRGREYNSSPDVRAI